MTTRLIKGGRPPKIRDAILAAVLERPSEGLTIARLTEIVGCTPSSAHDGISILRSMGLVTWLSLGRTQLYFATPEHRDIFIEEHKTGLSEDEVKLSGIIEQRRSMALNMLRDDSPLGLSAMEIAAKIGVTAGAMRHMLHDLVKAGEAYAGGHPKRVRWFGSYAAMEAAKPALDALEAERKSQVEAVLKAGHKAAAAARRANRAAKPKPEKKRATRGDCRVIPSAQRTVQERKPVEIIGMDTAKFTPAVPKPDHRYVVSQDHRGEFSALGIGRYAE